MGQACAAGPAVGCATRGVHTLRLIVPPTPPEQWDPTEQVNRCRVPGCEFRAIFVSLRLCRKHYDRARYRVMQGISWEQVLSPAGVVLLAVPYRRVGSTPASKRTDRKAVKAATIEAAHLWDPSLAPGVQSCITCENLLPVVPRFIVCGKNHWPDGIPKLSLRSVEACGLPAALIDYARNCPFYACFSGIKRPAP